MNILEMIQLLCKEKNMTVSKLERELKFGRGTLYKWNKSSPNVDKLIKVADYFDVSIDWLLGRSQFRFIPDKRISMINSEERSDFSENNRNDISIVMNFIMEQLGNPKITLMFNGKTLDNEIKDLLKNYISNILHIIRLITK